MPNKTDSMLRRARLSLTATVFMVAALGILRAETARAADAAPEAPGAAELLQQSRSRYAALKSYSDTATLVTEFRLNAGPPIIERHAIRTEYRAPRHFFLQFDEDRAAGGERVVIWCNGGDFRSWSSDTGVEQVYDGGRGALAFSLGLSPTRGVTGVIPPLIFQRVGMHGALLSLHDAHLHGLEKVGGREAHRITATSSNVDGRATRPATVWIDRETLLVLKVVLDTPAGSLKDSLKRETITFQPRVDPDLPDDRFRFTPPKQ